MQRGTRGQGVNEHANGGPKILKQGGGHDQKKGFGHRNPARSKPPRTPAIIQGVPLADGLDQGPASKITGDLVSFAEAARREKVTKAALLELDLKKRRGELIERDRVEAVAAKLGTLVRVGMEAIPAKVAPTVAGMDAPADVARYLQREIKAVLSDMAKGISELGL